MRSHLKEERKEGEGEGRKEGVKGGSKERTKKGKEDEGREGGRGERGSKERGKHKKERKCMKVSVIVSVNTEHSGARQESCLQGWTV